MRTWLRVALGLSLDLPLALLTLAPPAPRPVARSMSGYGGTNRRSAPWDRSSRDLSAGGVVCRSHSQGRKAGRPAGAGADQVRTDCKPEDREGTGSRCALDSPAARRRGDRINAPGKLA